MGHNKRHYESIKSSVQLEPSQVNQWQKEQVLRWIWIENILDGKCNLKKKRVRGVVSVQLSPIPEKRLKWAGTPGGGTAPVTDQSSRASNWNPHR